MKSSHAFAGEMLDVVALYTSVAPVVRVLHVDAVNVEELVCLRYIFVTREQDEVVVGYHASFLMVAETPISAEVYMAAEYS